MGFHNDMQHIPQKPSSKYKYVLPKETTRGNRYSFVHHLDCRVWRVSYCTSIIFRACVPHFAMRILVKLTYTIHIALISNMVCWWNKKHTLFIHQGKIYVIRPAIGFVSEQIRRYNNSAPWTTRWQRVQIPFFMFLCLP